MSDREQQQRHGQRRPEDSELLRWVMESATDFAIFTVDPNGIVTSWNVGAERMLGYEEAEILGNSGDVIFPPEELSAAEDERRRALAHGRAEDDRWQLRKDGTRIWVSGMLMRIAEQDRGFVKILRDRTSQHRAEQQLRASEEMFRVLATNIPQLVFRSRSNGDRTWASPQWSIFSGLAFAESLGHGWLDAIYPDDREATLAKWLEAQASGEYYCEHRLRRAADGHYRWHQTRAVPLKGSGDPVAAEWVGTMTDIHELRTLQEQQKVLLAELQHRTRNLLAVVQSLVHKTIRSSPSLDEFAAEYDSRLSALSRVQGLLGRTDVPIELRELVDGEFAAHLGREERAEKVVVEGPTAFLATTAAQSVALALHELVTNAVKYGALGQPRGKVSVRWAIERDGLTTRARVGWRESGVAMPAGGRTRSGYGSELIERALPYQLGTETRLDFEPDGVHCEIVVPLMAMETVHA
ncbi:MAG: PAS domain S-box protein [Acetobacteraceae bacterium]|nr:PAS domain S-box protein [Acetobacteraceae bacterium]